MLFISNIFGNSLFYNWGLAGVVLPVSKIALRIRS